MPDYVVRVKEPSSTEVQRLGLRNVDAYLNLTAVVAAGSGDDEVGHSHAYSESEPFDMDVLRRREIVRWSTAIEESGWRRAWGLNDRSELVGYLQLAGGALLSERHRVELGMEWPVRIVAWEAVDCCWKPQSNGHSSNRPSIG